MKRKDNLGDNTIGATPSLYGLASGLNSGCAIAVTQRFGAHDKKKLKASIVGMIELDSHAACFSSASIRSIRANTLRHTAKPASKMVLIYLLSTRS